MATGRVGLTWSGRPWTELLTPGGPVRSPFEWIRVGLATALGSLLILLVAFALLAGAGWLRDASAVQVCIGILALLLGLVALLLGLVALGAFVVGIIGLGLRSGATSMSLRDWVSMDKRG